MTFRPESYGNMIDLEEKAISESDDSYIFTGYAAVFGNVDQGNDVIAPGAFAKSLRENGLPLILYQHKMDDVVGVCTDAKEDKKGLWVKGELPKDDDFVRGRLVPQLKKRAIKGMSIGYKATQKETRKSDGARLLKEIRLYEASFVALPMNPLASVETVKGLVPFQALPIAKEDEAEWNAEAAWKRIAEHFDGSDEMRRAFLYADESKAASDWDRTLLIADFDTEKKKLFVNRNALYKAVASVSGARPGALPEEAEMAVKDHLERYYASLGLESPWKSISVSEWKALDLGEREARLRGLGVSRDLAKAFAPMMLGGQREADRSLSQREAGSPEDAKQLLTALASMAEVATAIVNSRKGHTRK